MIEYYFELRTVMTPVRSQWTSYGFHSGVESSRICCDRYDIQGQSHWELFFKNLPDTLAKESRLNPGNPDLYQSGISQYIRTSVTSRNHCSQGKWRPFFKNPRQSRIPLSCVSYECTSKPTYVSSKIFNENLIAVHKIKETLTNSCA